MTIRIACNQCGAALNVQSSLAGKRGKCPKCKAVITIPHDASASDDLALKNATPHQMINELHLRGSSACLVLFDIPNDGNYKLNLKEDGTVRCIGSDDMSEEQLNSLIKSLADLAKQNARDTVNSEGLEHVYELKGDKLGMHLDDFKRKYYRVIKGHHQTAPFSSEYSPNEAISLLLSEEWHTKAGIVHCTIEFPFERIQGMRGPTIAGIETNLLLYQFVDDQLFQISAYFDTDHFEHVRRSLIEKYGKPDIHDRKPVRLHWENSTCRIHLFRGRINPKEWSMLFLLHKRLHDVVQERTPDFGSDL